ncbi:transglutaminase domain-containing protein [Flindersiella endophytica]
MTNDSWARTAQMTSPGRYAGLYDGLPDSVAGLAAVAQGLLIHEHIAPAYGVNLSAEDRAPVHFRRIEQVLERIVATDGRPLTEPRDPGERISGNCRHFTVLLVSMLRTKGVPARARCGFGGYFGTNSYEDHWVCEYWNAADQAWHLADAQIDEVQRAMFPIDFDLMDVPRNRFLVAGDAWSQCRNGAADAAKFGLSMMKETGFWWIAGNLMRDVAALDNVEMLPWDVWGAMPGPQDQIDDELNGLFDRAAALTHEPDATIGELTALYREDKRLTVPETVRNAVLGRDEPV